VLGMATNLRLRDLTKAFGRTRAVDQLNLEINAGEFLTLLGPSGCGKSTTLRLIAGLERPDAGSIEMGDQTITSVARRVFVAPEKRGMGMVFQSYAVWPHMTVFENVAFPLRLRHASADEQRQRVSAALNMVGLGGLESRGATQLSGGQQQRVALARALVHNPEMLLLDEPLSNLDAKLREQMRLELRLLQKRLGITTIFVTHDQAEAMVLSDRIVVMNRGHIEQMGTPDDIYERPASRFVMDFVGRVNYVPAEIAHADNGRLTIRSVDNPDIQIDRSASNGEMVGDQVTLCIRPEDVLVAPPDSANGSGWRATVQAVTYLGHRVEYLLQAGTVVFQAEGPASTRFQEGDPVCLQVSPGAIRVWTHQGDEAPVPTAATPTRKE
jgi:ABC-type Fe3+/spermidine/putrescine transport system ATPase subunit